MNQINTALRRKIKSHSTKMKNLNKQINLC